MRLEPNYLEEATISYELRRRWFPNAPAVAPFNPDPGAALKTPVARPRPFFQYDYVPLPVYDGEAIAPELQLPRAPVSQAELLLREPETAASAPYGWEPITNGLALPRPNVIHNTPVPSNWHQVDYPVSQWHRLPPNSIAMTNRFRVPFVPWRRYTSGDLETPYIFDRPFLWHP